MRQVFDRLGWGIAGALSLAIVLIVASGVAGGPLDPTGTPAPTDSVRLPGTPISGATTITTPGHYYLTRDISVSGVDVNALVITAPNVSIDLGGFTIDGDDSLGSHGIWGQSGSWQLALSNGSITDFHVGVKVQSLLNAWSDDLHAVSNIRGYEIQAEGATLTDCTAKRNTEVGIFVLGARGHISRCHAVGNSGPGIQLGGRENVVADSNALLNNLSLTPTWKSIVLSGDNNTVRDTVVNGIRVEGDFNDIYDTDCYGISIEIVAGATNTNTAWPDHANIAC